MSNNTKPCFMHFEPSAKFPCPTQPPTHPTQIHPPSPLGSCSRTHVSSAIYRCKVSTQRSSLSHVRPSFPGRHTSMHTSTDHPEPRWFGMVPRRRNGESLRDLNLIISVESKMFYAYDSIFQTTIVS